MSRTHYVIVSVIILTVVLFVPQTIQAIDTTTSRFIHPEYSRRISMDFKNAELNDVLKILSQQSGKNFISSEEVIDKTITLYLDDVPVEEALERILRANNLTYDVDGPNDIFVVKEIQEPELKLVTRVYPLKYATVSGADLEDTITFAEEEEASGGGAQGGTEAREGGIVVALEAMLTGDGNINEDPRTNSLIITDLPSQFPIIEQTIARLDVPVPQILIEVEMLDISKTVADDIGIKFTDNLFVFTGAQKQLFYPFDQNKALRDGAAFTTRYTPGSLNAAGMQATVDFLRSHSDTKNLARPKILTLNNKKAEIRISTDEAIGLSTRSSGEGAGAQTTTEAERVETGVFLTVTPQANLKTGEIKLAVSPRVIQARTGASFGGTTFKDAEERGAKATLRMVDGQTVLIGGLIRENITDVETKLPLLGDMPFFGGAFRHRDRTVEERELVIFLTPHIVKQASYAQQAANRIDLHREQGEPTQRKSEINKALSAYNKRKL